MTLARHPLFAFDESADPTELSEHGVFGSGWFGVSGRVRVLMNVVHSALGLVVGAAARIRVDRTSLPVQPLRQCDDVGDGVRGFVEHTPTVCLVERLPLNDTRMVATTVYHGGKIGNEERNEVGGRPTVLLWRVLKDDHPEAISVIIPTLRVDLLMKSYHVEAVLGDGGEVRGEASVRGSGVDSVGPERLVQPTREIDGLVVQQRSSVRDLEGPHTEV
mmetsp:Transcript_17132/g.40879  ORF Transcript_17132/g.40879 Transcript_17132/m.40879 type:complete len:218 (-) Transcript_17132:22-675(-)